MASSYGTDASKDSLRSNYLAARKTLASASRAVSDANIQRTLRRFKLFSQAGLVLAYVSFGEEVSTRGLICDLLSEGRRVAVPRCNTGEKTLDFCEIASFDELVPGAHGILEPAADAPVVTVPEMVGSVCLVPGLVFDACGHRVGYGAGYYDRFLAFYPGDKIALARTTQISSNPLPVDTTDVPVDFIVTEDLIWSCR